MGDLGNDLADLPKFFLECFIDVGLFAELLLKIRAFVFDFRCGRMRLAAVDKFIHNERDELARN